MIRATRNRDADNSMQPATHVKYKARGFCPICEAPSTFSSESEWYRDHLLCESCPGGSVPRERALALVLNELMPDWRNLAIHESSPAPRGISVKLAREAPGYVASQFFPNRPCGETVNGFRNENLEALSFADNTFDLTISLDVMEHVYHPDRALREIDRTLKVGGYYICTFPVRKEQTTAMERRFELQPDGTRIDIKPPEIRGNPVSSEGSIVTIDWGYDLHQQFADWTSMDVRVYRFDDRTHGILGEYTDVIVCRKSASAVQRRREVAEHHRRMTNKEWLGVLKRSIDEPIIDGIDFPRFPDEALQRSTVGSSYENTLSEAYVFYDEMKRRADQFSIPVDTDSTILDFGCAWGRYLRFFWRDVLERNLHGVDVNPDVITLCNRLQVPGVLQVIDPHDPLPFDSGYFSHAFSYSVLSHLPEPVSRHWIGEIARVLKPSSLFMFTVEPPRFIDFVAAIPANAESPWHQGLRNALTDPEAARRKAANGEFVYLSTGGGPHLPPDVYGDAVISKEYAIREWSDHFEIVEYIDDPSLFWQAVVIARRR